MGAVLIFAMFGVLVGTAVTGVWLTLRRVRRSTAITRTSMLLRTFSAPHSAGREVARLRITLFDSMCATGRVLRGVPAPRVLGDLATDLQRAAAVTDKRLALLATEPDRELLRQLLPPLRASVASLTRASADVRGTAWQFGVEPGRDTTAILTREVTDQVAGLRAGLAEVQAIQSRAFGRATSPRDLLAFRAFPATEHGPRNH